MPPYKSWDTHNILLLGDFNLFNLMCCPFEREGAEGRIAIHTSSGIYNTRIGIRVNSNDTSFSLVIFIVGLQNERIKESPCRYKKTTHTLFTLHFAALNT